MSGGGGGGCPMWVLTYADMITVLMAFFVIMSTLNKPEKKEKVTFELVEQFGTPDAVERFLRAAQRRKAEEARDKKSKAKPAGRPGYDAKVTAMREGDRLTMGGPTYFPPGMADLSDDGKSHLGQIADVLRGKTHIIAVKAYRPRSLPSPSVFASPTALASARAETVCKFLVEHGLREELMRIEVVAPIENSNLILEKAGLSPSDRVDVVVLEASAFDFEPVAVSTD